MDVKDQEPKLMSVLSGGSCGSGTVGAVILQQDR